MLVFAFGFVFTSCQKDSDIAVESVVLSQSTLTLIVSNSERLIATIQPIDAANRAISWSSSASDVVTVDDLGNIKAVSVGNATITVTTDDGGKTATCYVTVNPSPASGVTLNKTTLRLIVGDTESLIAIVHPEDAREKTVTWMSSDDNIVTVNNGAVTAVSIGSATITVKTVDGDNIATCNVTVMPIPITVETWEIGSPVASDVIATFDSNGTLSISGTGAMQDRVVWGSAKENVTNLVINSGVTTIGSNVFMDFTSITSIVIPNTVTDIGDYAFFQSSSLSSVFFGSNIASIGLHAFYRCNLTEVHIENPNPPSVDDAFLTLNRTCKLYVPPGTQSKYAAARWWRGNFDIVGFVPIEFVQESKYMNLEIYEHQLPITTEQLSEWLSNLDRMYEQFVYLMNGLKPFDGRKMTIRSVDGIPAWAYAGYPIQWNSAYIADQLEAFVIDGDWSFGIMHEMGHNFGGQGFEYRNTSYYNFDEEIFANFRMYLALTRVNDATVNMNGVIYKGAGIADYYKLDYDYKMENNELLNSDGAMYTLIRLGNHYQKDGDHGFWLYKEAFAIINRLPYNASENDWPGWLKFRLFLDLLSNCVGRDVRETFSAKELDLIESAYWFR